MTPEIITIATAAVQRYAETHPRPVHVNQKQAAQMIGVSQATMIKLVRHGTFQLNTVGMIPIGQIDDAIAAKKNKAA